MSMFPRRGVETPLFLEAGGTGRDAYGKRRLRFSLPSSLKWEGAMKVPLRRAVLVAVAAAAATLSTPAALLVGLGRVARAKRIGTRG
jgi:hypothetical protein